jgi:putative DNA primase/helicase
MTAPDLRTIARALGGEISGRQILAPGPGHSRLDRSLSIRIEPAAPGGFVVHSFAGDDPIVCKDHVRQWLGLPEWKRGDEQDRRVDASQREQFERTAMDREAAKRPRSEDDQVRIKRAVAIWNEGRDPRGTLAETYLNIRKLTLYDDLAGGVLGFSPRCPWRNETSGKTDRVPALIAAFRSINDGTVTAIQRIALDAAAPGSAAACSASCIAPRSCSIQSAASSRSARVSRPAWPRANSALARRGHSARPAASPAFPSSTGSID